MHQLGKPQQNHKPEMIEWLNPSKGTDCLKQKCWRWSESFLYELLDVACANSNDIHKSLNTNKK